MEQYRQGDVLIMEIAAIPTDAAAVDVPATGFVLAEGEHTGHKHIAVGPGLQAFRKGSALYISSGDPFDVNHEDHAAFSVKPGAYEIRTQREHRPGEAAPRRVGD